MFGLTQRFLHPTGGLSTGELRGGPWWLGKIMRVQVRRKESLKYRSYARIGDAEIKYDMRLNALSWLSGTGSGVRTQLEVWAIDWYETKEERSRSCGTGCQGMGFKIGFGNGIAIAGYS